jgi:hypothetical protein
MKSASVALALSLCAAAAQAEPTSIMVRAQSQDAKFIGDQMGGIAVTLSDARTGAVLAKGLTTGGTGDTGVIMKSARMRGGRLSDAKTSGFAAVIDIERPTLVRLDARGPVGKPASAVSVSSTQWVIPGRAIAGDGWVVSFPGLVVEPTATPDPAGGLKVAAKVTLMCGCPIEPGGLWDAGNYAVEAVLLSGRREVARAPLAYAGQTSQFAGVLPAVRPGRYVMRVTAVDATTSNAGVVELPVTAPSRR